MIDPADVADRLGVVSERLAAAGGIDVRIVAVTKAFGADAIAAAKNPQLPATPASQSCM